MSQGKGSMKYSKAGGINILLQSVSIGDCAWRGQGEEMVKIKSPGAQNSFEI